MAAPPLAVAAPAPHPAPSVFQATPLSARRRTAVAPAPAPAPGPSFEEPRLADRLGSALRCGVPPGPAPRRNPLPRWPPNLRKRRPRRRPSSHPHPGAAPARSVLPHRRPAPPVLGPEGAPKIQGHRVRAEDGDVASRSCSVHRAERGAVQSRGTQQRGGLHPFRRRRVRVGVPRWLMARLRHRLPRRHTLPTRRDPIDQIAWVLELSERRRPPARRGAGELDDDMLLRLHPVPGEPGEVARFTAGKRRRRRAGTGRRRSSSVLNSSRLMPCSVRPLTCTAGFQRLKNHCAVYHVQLHGSDIQSSLRLAFRSAECHDGCWVMRRFSENGQSNNRSISLAVPISV